MQVTETTATLSERMKRLPAIWMTPGRVHVASVVDVQDAVHYQTILGFGATLSDSSAWLIHAQLGSSARNLLLHDLFSSAGIDLSYIRLPMGASGFSATGRPYSYDDMPAGRSDPALTHFSITHDLRYTIPTLRQILSVNPRLFIIANPWSAPGWMKANQRSDNYGNTGTVLPNAWPPLAAYFVKYIEAYRQRGVAIAAVTPQNEPGVAADPGMELPEPDEATFIERFVHPAFAAAGLRTKIYGLDMGWDMAPYADQLASGPARRDLSGIAWHCYYGTPEAMTAFHAIAPGLEQVENECSPELRPFSTAELLIGSLRNWASAVALLNLALDQAGGPVELPNTRCGGCKGVVAIDDVTHHVHRGARYYQLGQVSKFVSRGAVRVATGTFVNYATDAWNGFYLPSPGLDDVAFVNPDGQRVLVTYNNSSRGIGFAVRWHGRVMTYSQPAGAMTTFTWR